MLVQSCFFPAPKIAPKLNLVGPPLVALPDYSSSICGLGLHLHPSATTIKFHDEPQHPAPCSSLLEEMDAGDHNAPLLKDEEDDDALLSLTPNDILIFLLKRREVLSELRAYSLCSE